MSKRNLLIGVDVGGTNTDSVLVDPSTSGDIRVLAWNKEITTAEVSKGIYTGISKLLDESRIEKADVASVTIGTTHFINAVIEQDSSRLSRVAVLRLCGPYSRKIHPFCDFPKGLANLLNGYIGYINGGYHVDGNEVQPLNEEEIVEHAEEIQARGIYSVVINGIFSSLKADQELKVKEILQKKIPGVKVVMSHTVSGVGYIERENASILNASILKYAEKIICSFISAVFKLGLKCSISLTQNDGSVLSAAESMKLPIKTFSSGTTNSMRGASFLSNLHGKSALVIDVGGTTADVGLLLASGFPRQSSSYSVIGGVRMNFSMPHVESMGLGGGSIVRDHDGKVSVGPDSVGADIVEKAFVFGGDTLTATDVAVSLDKSRNLDIGDPSNVNVSKELQKSYLNEIQFMLERIVDKMKTSPEEIPVLVVGGGSFIVPENLKGASKVIRPNYYNVANAIGAAMGKISSEIHTVKYLPPGGEHTKESYLELLKMETFKKAFEKGASESSIEIAFLSYDPIPYVENTFEFFVKTISDVDYSKLQVNVDEVTISLNEDEDNEEEEYRSIIKNSQVKTDEFTSHVDYISYKPHINEQEEWVLSEVDLEFLRIGCYILGCGGGGEPYPRYLEAKNLLKEGRVFKIIDVENITNYTNGGGAIVSGCSAGSPTVSHEQLPGDQMSTCYEYMTKFIGKKPELIYPVEIGGGNGFAVFDISSKHSIPIVDCDLMGRAYPTHWQTLPTVFSEGKCVYAPTVFSNGNGNTTIVADSKSDFLIEKVMRAALSELGSTVNLLNPPMTAEDVSVKTIHGSLSLAWRIGRAVKIGRQKSEVYRMPEIILESVNNSGKLLFTGKVIGVERKLFKGHVWGELVIQSTENSDQKMVIPFKNENIYAKVISDDGTEEVGCSVPDLIAVIDSNTGEAVGTPDLHYGLFVFVLGISPSNKWTDTERALEIGGPKAFDLPEINYRPVSTYSRPKSVIQEFSCKEYV